MRESSIDKTRYSVDIQEITFHVGDLKCTSCASTISQVVKKLDGVSECIVNYANDSCKVEYNPTKISKKAILKRIQELGYSASEVFGEEEFRKNQKNTLLNFGVAAFLSMNIMMLTIPVYWDYFEKVEMNIVSLFSWLMFFLCIPVLFINGWGILKRAAKSIIEGYPGMETLIGIGAISAFIYSTIELFFSQQPHLYYDTSATLIVIILFGKFIENHFRYKASLEVNKLSYVLPRKVRVRDLMHNMKWIPASELKVNDVFEVHAGETIPADGVVVNGKAIVDESIFTGEAKGILKIPKTNVIAGCVLKNGFLQVSAKSRVNESALASIVKIIENSLNKKSNLQNFSDKVARYFIPIIISIALVVFIYMLTNGFGFEASFLRALTVLVIACPCALAIAVPVSLVAAFGTLAKNGIFIRNPDVIGLINKITDIVFDKTGTLTYGKYSVNKFVGVDDDRLYNILYTMETFSSHPVAEAIKDFLSTKIENTKLINIDQKSVQLLDNGLYAEVDSENWVIGNEKLFKHIPENLLQKAQENMSNGNTIVYFGKNNLIEGFFSIGDVSREDINDLIVKLKNSEKNIHLLSGDKLETTRSFANALGIDSYLGEKSPYEKIQFIQKLKAENKKVMMIGDGINDAAALSEADIGVALSSGTDLAKISSSIIIFKNFLYKLPYLFSYSKKIRIITSQNFIWAVIYNFVGIWLAISGLLNPLIAAIMMMLSSITVVLNSLRLLKFNIR